MRNVLRRPDFRRLFAGLFFSMTAESILLLALAIWAKSLTGSNGLAGAAILAVVAPTVLAPVLGYFVDRFRRKPFLVTALVVSAIGLTPLFLVKDRGELWILYAVGFGYGLSFIAVSGALNGLIKEVVPDELLAEANGALQTVKQGLRLIAPLLGAGLYVSTKGWGLAVVGIAGFILAATIIFSLRVPEEAPPISEMRWGSEVAAGVRHVTRTPSLRRAIIGMTAAVLVFGFSESVFFAFVDQGLHRPPAFLAVIICAQGIGGLLGGLTSAPLIRRLGEIGATALGVALFIPVLVTSLWPSEWLVFPSIVLCGFGLPYAIVGLMTLMQRVTPGEIIGRVSAAFEALLSGPQALSIALGAFLVEQLPFRVLFGAMALVSAAAAVYLWRGRGLSRGGESDGYRGQGGRPGVATWGSQGSRTAHPVLDQAAGDRASVGQPEVA